MHPYADLAGAMANAGLTHILEMERGGQRYFQLADALGSTTALTTHSGTIAERTGYDSYGNPSTPITTGNPFAFTGVLHEPTTALYLMPLRAYDPALGRFLSEDPLPAVSPYLYVSNAPVDLIDPTGAKGLAGYDLALTSAGLGGAIVGGLDGGVCGAVTGGVSGVVAAAIGIRLPVSTGLMAFSKTVAMATGGYAGGLYVAKKLGC